MQKVIVAMVLALVFLGYTFYLYFSLPMRETFLSPLADRGKTLWQEKNCNACHQVYGLGGYLGPDLTNEYSLRGPDIIRALLTTGTNTMPAYKLTEEEISALLAYLQHIDHTGKADPRSFTIYFDGTIKRK